MTKPLLSVRNLTLRFGGVTALNDVSFDLQAGHILGLIGPNGAGKSSLVNVITGSYRANEGTIHLGDKDILSLPAYKRAELGLSRTFQNLALFGGMSVYDNVMVGRHLHIKEGVVASMLPLPFKARSRDERSSSEKVHHLLERLGLAAVRDSEVGSLPYGFQKRVELARALASEPHVLLLDEPFAGMTPDESRELAKTILELWEERRLTILMIEHNMGLIMDVADIVVVLDFGRVVTIGEPQEVRSNPEVIRAYIGGKVNSLAEA
ncbi:branched-chain amino acid transport system ATP-binding protein [Rhodoligotrophos appendicifer]|uniref:ABC transporter ATP-binding protein n=1 Tax=Rhodoligotrophos appendicifer TaxID=987056 RepID=UPI00118474B8|nr:ABC transporter ATP-binding protein [Rhodoligotrophos appendicifer]